MAPCASSSLDSWCLKTFYWLDIRSSQETVSVISLTWRLVGSCYLLLALLSDLHSSHSPSGIFATFSSAVFSCLLSANINVSSFSFSFLQQSQAANFPFSLPSFYKKLKLNEPKNSVTMSYSENTNFLAQTVTHS